jgi:hypothetical protein
MTKASKESVKYTDYAMVKNERCALCKYFEAADRRCKIVLGMIKTMGWCEEFKREPPKKH